MGSGSLETVYQEFMGIELVARNIPITAQAGAYRIEVGRSS